MDVLGVSAHFGGLIALDDVNLHVRPGAITGLIGPNGAGKTTLLNVCSGFVGPDAGRILLGGNDITGLSVAARARRGLGRTFQHLELFESLTVRHAVALGLEAAMAGSNAYRHVVGRQGAAGEAGTRAADPVEEAIEECGIADIADQRVSNLSSGQRRLVELARCLTWPFSVLLLDEPTAGLDRSDSQRFGQILARVVDERDIGILLVEHDVSLVMSLCDRVAVLDFGRLLLEGTPSEVMASEAVRTAYLGAPTGI